MNTAAWNATWAATLLGNLHQGGVEDVVVSPGSRNTPLVVAAEELEGLRTHVILDERVAGFFALGRARMTGRPVALLCTSGSAGAHHLPALIEAREAGIPLIAITADRPRELHHAGAAQTIEQHGLHGPHVLATYSLNAPTEVSPRWLAGIALQAIQTATGSPPGPVHINAPYRKELWSESASPGAPVHLAELVPSGGSVNPDGVKRMQELMGTARNGVFVCGPDIRAQHGGTPANHEGLVSLATALGWPILADPLSGIRHGAPTEAPVVGSYDVFLRNDRTRETLKADVVIRTGRIPTSTALCTWLQEQVGAEHVLLNGSNRWTDPLHTTTVWIDGEADPLLSQIASSPVSTLDSAWADLWATANTGAIHDLKAHIEEAGTGPLSEMHIAATLIETQPEGSNLHVASGMAVREVDTFGPRRDEALRITSNRGANGIDGTLSTALGQASATHRGDTTVLLGDLAFLHDLGGLSAASRSGEDLLVVIVDNGGGAIFERLPIATSPVFEKCFLTPHHQDLKQVAGAWTPHVLGAATVDEFETALATLRGLRGLRVLHLQVDRDEDLARHASFFEAVQSRVPLG